MKKYPRILISIVLIGTSLVLTSVSAANVVRVNMLLTAWFNAGFGMTSEHAGGIPQNVMIPVLEVFDAKGNATLFAAGQDEAEKALKDLPAKLKNLRSLTGYQSANKLFTLMKDDKGQPFKAVQLDKSLPTVVYIGLSTCKSCVLVHKDLNNFLHMHPKLRANVLDVSIECPQCPQHN